MKKRIVCLMLAVMMMGTQVATVSASREEELREEQAWTSAQLDATYSQIDQLYAAKEQLQNEIAALDANLVNVMVSIQTLEGDISNKEADIKQTQSDLQKAQNAKDKQYEAMKQRIQYLYEKGGNDAWFQMMVNAENLSELLTKAEYTQKMYDYDRQSLEKYANTIDQVTQLGNKYQQEKAELEGMKQEYEAESVNLQAAIDERRAVSADCDNEIAYAQQMANEYAALIEQQQAEIERLEAERIAAEEEARRQAELAAAEEAARQEAEAEDETVYDEEGNEVDAEDALENGETLYDEEGNEIDPDSVTDEEESDGDVEYDEYGNVIDSDNTVDPEEYQSSGSGSGSSVVDFATQFVGNPYVWGGTSLTDGADCSGFVQSIYSNFGYSIPRTATTQYAFGRKIAVEEAQAGDLLFYSYYGEIEHVALYTGEGTIVHASTEETGIIETPMDYGGYPSHAVRIIE